MRGSHFWCVQLCDTVFNVLFISTWLFMIVHSMFPAGYHPGKTSKRKKGKIIFGPIFGLSAERNEYALSASQ